MSFILGDQFTPQKHCHLCLFTQVCTADCSFNEDVSGTWAPSFVSCLTSPVNLCSLGLMIFWLKCGEPTMGVFTSRFEALVLRYLTWLLVMTINCLQQDQQIKSFVFGVSWQQLLLLFFQNIQEQLLPFISVRVLSPQFLHILLLLQVKSFSTNESIG